MELNAFTRLYEVGRDQLTYEEKLDLYEAINVLNTVINETIHYVNASAVEILALNAQIRNDQETIRYLKDRVGLLERTLQANR